LLGGVERPGNALPGRKLPGGIETFGWTLLYLAATVLQTWPLATKMTSHLPNSSIAGLDLLHIGWSMAHQSRALFESLGSYADAGIFYPASHSLFYGQTAIGALPVFAPTYLATGNPTLALNILLLVGCTATALSLHLVLRFATGSNAAGFVAAWTFLMSRWLLWTFVPSVPNYSLLFLFPIVILRVSQPWSSFRAALWVLPLIVAQCLPDVAYMAFSLLAALGVVAVMNLATRSRRADGWRLMTILAMTVVILAPLYAMYAYISSINPELATQTRWLGMGQGPTAFPWAFYRSGHPASVPILATPLVIAGSLFLLLRWREEGSSLVTRIAAVSMVFLLVGLWISLTPSILWFETTVEMPHAWFAEIFPLYERFRVPARLGISALIGICMLSGLATAEIIRRLGARRQAPLSPAIAASIAIVIGAVWAGQTFWGIASPVAPPVRQSLLAYPVVKAPSRDSDLVQALESGSGTVLELPTNPRRPLRDSEAMYRAIFHQRPLMNGYNGYWPSGYLDRVSLARKLPDPESLAELVRGTNLTHIVVHPRALAPAARQRWEKLPEIPDGVLVREAQDPDGRWILFRVQEPDSHQPTARTGESNTSLPPDREATGVQ
jgi:hypothetical protein